MPDEDLNRIDADRSDRPNRAGDVPEQLRRRYVSETRRGLSVEVTYYVDATTRAPAFKDRGGRLSTDRSDPNVARDLIAIAAHRGWTSISVRGETSFRREVWRAAVAAGIEVRGYRPTERDQQDLARAGQSGSRRATSEAPDETRGDAQRGLDAQTRRRIVEAVVRNRIVDLSLQAKILAAVKGRLGPTKTEPVTDRSRSHKPSEDRVR